MFWDPRRIVSGRLGPQTGNTPSGPSLERQPATRVKRHCQAVRQARLAVRRSGGTGQVAQAMLPGNQTGSLSARQPASQAACQPVHARWPRQPAAAGQRARPRRYLTRSPPSSSQSCGGGRWRGPRRRSLVCGLSACGGPPAGPHQVDPPRKGTSSRAH